MTTIVPDQLNITINTSVPGYQKITYKPSMTIKDISKDDKTIQFNPFVKLNQTIVDKIPENLRKKQFFNRDLFKSLITYTNSNQSFLSSMSSPPAKNLKQAQSYGYIDNNIKVTLKSIFPENSVIYIGDKPYVIADVQWTIGDVRIDTKKKKEEIDPSKITDVALYKKLMNDEIIESEKQLKEIDETLVYGPNYSGPKNTLFSGITSDATPKTSPVPDNSTKQKEQTPFVSVETTKQKEQGSNIAASIAASVPSSESIVKPLLLMPPTQGPTLPVSSQISYPASNSTNLVSRRDREMKPNPNVEIIEERPAPQEVSKIGTLEPVVESDETLKPSTRLAGIIRNIFKTSNYINLINGVFKFSEENIKGIIRDTLKNTTTIEIKEGANISINAYKQSVDGVQIMETEGDGNCFFSAIAMAINYYNFYNQSNRIISKLGDRITYGSGNNIFTPNYLRSLVYNYIKNLKTLDDLLENAAVSNADVLNDKFQAGLVNLTLNNLDNDEEEYRKLASDIYKSNDNFLVQNVDSIPKMALDNDNPFKPIRKENLENYILSKNYWGDEIAIEALCIELKLNIITFELMKNPDRLRIPFANLLKNSKCNNWDKYLFLLLSNNHYDLITFKYFQNPPKPNIINTIFNYTPSFNDDLPPIYILFIIYGSFYKKLTPENIPNFNFYPDIMSKIDSAVNNFGPFNKIKLQEYFQTSNNQQQMIGGESKRPYAEQVMKSASSRDDSKLAYYITIDLQVYPGTSIPPNEIENLKCDNKWNAVRKAYSKLTGTPYVIPPIYNQKTLKNKEDNSNNKTQNNKNPSVSNNARTFKNNNHKGGKKRTIKKR